MNINRNTYEEFFLLYVDNELSQSERREVEQFLEENPDLKEELEMLQDVVLQPEPQTIINKENLFRHNFPVTESNFEEYFILYGDDELSREEKEYVEQFVYRHPQHQAEFELILRSKIQPDNSIVHPDKESLYRHEKKDRPVVYMQWWKIAVAAILLLFIGGSGWYFTTHTQHATAPLAKVSSPDTAPSEQAVTPEKNQPEIAANEKQPVPEVQINNTELQEQPKSGKTSNAIAAVSKKSSGNRNISSSPIVQQERKQVAPIETKEVTEPKIDLIASNIEEKAPIIDEALSEEQIRGGKTKPEYVEAAFPEENNVVYVANTAVNKKNKLRGVFRKASRIFEKATNIDPTEGDRSVRIAGFEIALK